jgi:hypothetical protein
MVAFGLSHGTHKELSLLQVLPSISPICEAILTIYTLALIYLLGRYILPSEVQIIEPNTRGMMSESWF